VVPENIHTLPMDGHWKFRGGGGFKRPKFFKESMKLNWNFQRGGGVQSEKPSVGEIWIFSGTTQSSDENKERDCQGEDVLILRQILLTGFIKKEMVKLQNNFFFTLHKAIHKVENVTSL